MDDFENGSEELALNDYLFRQGELNDVEVYENWVNNEEDF